MTAKRSDSFGNRALQALVVAALSLGLAYVAFVRPNEARQHAIEMALLSLVVVDRIDDCRAAIAEEGLNSDDYERAGGYVTYSKMPDGQLAMSFNALFANQRGARLACGVPVARSRPVEIIQIEAEE